MLHCFVGGRHLHLGLRGQIQTTAAMDLWARLGLQPGSDLLSALQSKRVLRDEAARPAISALSATIRHAQMCGLLQRP